jgi:hypothetical protein
MTVAISLNLSDGVVLAADSAATVPGEGGSVLKTYENAEKLFPLGDRPIGVAIYGMAALGSRSVSSYLNEFEQTDPGDVLGSDTSLSEIVEALRDFLLNAYRADLVPLLEQALGTSYENIPVEQIPILGVVVGGFSHGAFLSEVWHISIPTNEAAGSAAQERAPGQFGSNWYAMLEPIRRYFKGYDPALLGEVLNWALGARGAPTFDDQPMSPQEIAGLQEILDRHEYSIPVWAMPMAEGIAHARFLVELVISHHRYAIGAPVVGGAVRVGSVTHREGRFHILGSEA